MLHYLAIFAISFLVTLIVSHFLVPRLKRFGMTGKDMNKPDMPEVAEMGVIAIVAGFTAGALLAICRGEESLAQRTRFLGVTHTCPAQFSGVGMTRKL